jgi:hypothetical protein
VLALAIALFMAAARTTQTSVNFYQTTRRNIPEESHLHRLRVFENRVLRRIFGPKRDKVIGDCGKLHNKLKENEMGWTCSMCWIYEKDVYNFDRKI